MAITAADAADRVEQLTALTRRLTDLLAEEARAFEARRPHEVAARAEETGRLANIYRHETARIKADPSLIAGAPVEGRRTLIAATETFEAVLARHGRALGAAKAIAEGLVHAIAEEVSNARSAVSPYRPDGRAAKGEASAITLNKTA
jgi:hypothetical protein